MSIKGIKPGQVIPFPNQQVNKKTEKSAEKEVFDKALDKAEVAEKKSVVKTDKPASTQNVIPIQPNYHVLSQLKKPYTSEQLHQDAWEYIFSGKAPKFDNPEDKTAFALKVADLKMWSMDYNFSNKEES